MEDNITAVVAPIKCRMFEMENKKLHSAFKETDSSMNKMASNLFKLIGFIETNEILCKSESMNDIVKVFSQGVGLPLRDVRAITFFLISEGYISNLEGYIRLTEEGRLLEIMDESFVSMLMLKYFWESAEWNEISPYKEKNNFLRKSAREFLAMFILKFCDNPETFIIGKTSDIEGMGMEPLVIPEELLNNKSTKYIFKNVFEVLGLLRLNNQGNKPVLSLTGRGRKVFEYFGNAKIEEYNRLTEESWECYDRGNFEQAYEIARSVVSVIPDNIEAYNVIGCVLVRKKEYGKARNIFLHAISLYDRVKYVSGISLSAGYEAYISLNYNLGLCLFYDGDFFQALKVLKGIKTKGRYNPETIEEIIETTKNMIIKEKNTSNRLIPMG